MTEHCGRQSRRGCDNFISYAFARGLLHCFISTRRTILCHERSLVLSMKKERRMHPELHVLTCLYSGGIRPPVARVHFSVHRKSRTGKPRSAIFLVSIRFSSALIPLLSSIDQVFRPLPSTLSAA